MTKVTSRGCLGAGEEVGRVGLGTGHLDTERASAQCAYEDADQLNGKKAPKTNGYQEEINLAQD